MKKFISICMCLVLTVCFLSCSKASGESETSETSVGDIEPFEIPSGPYYTYSSVPMIYETPGASNANYEVSFGQNIISMVNSSFTVEQEMAYRYWNNMTSPLPTSDDGEYCLPTMKVLIYDYSGNLNSEIDLADYAGEFCETPKLFVDSSDNIHVVVTKPLNYLYLVFNYDGELVSSTTLNLSGDLYFVDMAYSSDDGLVLLINEMNGFEISSYIIALDDEGSESNRYEFSDGIMMSQYLYIYGGKVYTIIYDMPNEKRYFASVSDIISGSADGYFEMSVLPIEDELYMQNSNGLIYKSYEDNNYYLWSPVTDLSALIVDVSDIDIGIYPAYFCMTADYDLICIGTNGLDSSYYLTTITSCDTDLNADKTVISVAGIGLNDDPVVQYMKFKFNSTHDDYEIEIIDYLDTYGYEYSNEELGMMIAEDFVYGRLSGDAPDIIMDVSGTFPFYTISNDNCLVDLSSYYLEDLSLDDYNFDIIANSEIGGNIYSIPLAYSVDGFITYEENFDAASDWTIQSFNTIASSYDGQMIPNVLPENLLIGQLRTSLPEYFDIASMEVTFDSEAFVDLLEWSMENGDYVVDFPSSPYVYCIQDGMHYCEYYPGIGMSTLQLISNTVGAPINVVGFPSSNLGALPNYRLAISADCADADVAWDFVLAGFDATPQNALARILFPLSYDAFEYGLDYNLAYMEGEPSVNDVVIGLADRINCVEQYDPEIFAIVREESLSYFSGDKSAEEVADLIQDRCETIMSERYG